VVTVVILTVVSFVISIAGLRTNDEGFCTGDC
jgi:hypothetical protein